MPLDGVVPIAWRDAVIERDAQGRCRINRITYEICALQALREQLRCKEIWVEGADRYRNPDEDLPVDFDIRRDEHYATLGLPRDADAFIARVQTDMTEALAMFHSGLAANPFVRILKRGGGRITLTPLEKQEDPVGLAALKTEIGRRWPMTSLLDMLKEADLRIGFTNAFRTVTDHENLSRAVLQERLLLCLNGIGTNTGLRRMAAGQDDVTYRDLLYVRRRFLTRESMREAIAQVVNATLRARHPGIWDDGTTACAADSKQFGMGSEPDDGVLHLGAMAQHALDHGCDFGGGWGLELRIDAGAVALDMPVDHDSTAAVADVPRQRVSRSSLLYGGRRAYVRSRPGGAMERECIRSGQMLSGHSSWPFAMPRVLPRFVQVVRVTRLTNDGAMGYRPSDIALSFASRLPPRQHSRVRNSGRSRSCSIDPNIGGGHEVPAAVPSREHRGLRSAAR